MLGFLRRLFQHPADALIGAARSPKWAAVRNAYAAKHPKCAVCESTEIEVHHLLPVHVMPERELDPNNLISLCRDHHFTFGHFCDWRSWNANVRINAMEWRSKIQTRPKT